MWRQTRYTQKQKRVKGKDIFPDRRENMQALQDHTTEGSFICRGRLKMDIWRWPCKSLIKSQKKNPVSLPGRFLQTMTLDFQNYGDDYLWHQEGKSLIHVDSSESYSLNSSYIKKKINQIDYFREKETKSNLKEHRYLADKGLKERPEEKEILWDRRQQPRSEWTLKAKINLIHKKRQVWSLVP